MLLNALVRYLSLAATALATTLPAGASERFLPKWRLVFEDTFAGPELDGSKWTTCYWWDDHGCTNLSNKELQWYVPGGVSVGDGALKLTARREDVVGYKGQTFNYTSGMVTSGRYYAESPDRFRFLATYGYFEIRAKVPAGRGLWPAFWLLPATHKSKPEIDVMEVLGHRTNELQMHIHYKDPSGTDRSVGTKYVGPDLSANWHVYSVRWEPDKIIWYLDGVERWRYTGPGVSQEPMYLLLNLAVGGNWPGSPDEKTVFPATFFVDYVKVWHKDDSGSESGCAEGAQGADRTSCGHE